MVGGPGSLTVVTADLRDQCLKALGASVREQHPLTLIRVGVLAPVDEVCKGTATVHPHEGEVGGRAGTGVMMASLGASRPVKSQWSLSPRPRSNDCCDLTRVPPPPSREHWARSWDDLDPHGRNVVRDLVDDRRNAGPAGLVVASLQDRADGGRGRDRAPR